MDDLYADAERRISAAPCGNCPRHELAGAFLKLCHGPGLRRTMCPACIGLEQPAALLDQLLDGQGSQTDLDTHPAHRASPLMDSADGHAIRIRGHAPNGPGRVCLAFRTLPGPA
ncbi:MAG: hypothetical protein ACLT9P_01280 [Evtepia gabavorous]